MVKTILCSIDKDNSTQTLPVTHRSCANNFLNGQWKICTSAGIQTYTSLVIIFIRF
jgi:hypothetical protein